MERVIEVTPAFDKRNVDPKKDYGIHGAELWFYLIGERGAIQFGIYTNWFLPHVQDEVDSRIPDHRFPWLSHKPSPCDIGYHSRVPQYDDAKPLTDNCPIIGGVCYYDGSSLQAEDVFKIMVEGGSDALWAEMERRYNELFSEQTMNPKPIEPEGK